MARKQQLDGWDDLEPSFQDLSYLQELGPSTVFSEADVTRLCYLCGQFSTYRALVIHTPQPFLSFSHSHFTSTFSCLGAFSTKAEITILSETKRAGSSDKGVGSGCTETAYEPQGDDARAFSKGKGMKRTSYASTAGPLSSRRSRCAVFP
ncbi:hypothetical protein MSAN_01538600 [Mycena sanguinolenta]|uniref:Uncharacterized protein n=1 Tax=Mycena sanguinolenta TaxID=230812 RepID=A0A8H6Y3K0_9AGAR|nr:hypothetical protein MSAN_01538600 [Mycena sanguinolenta]